MRELFRDRRDAGRRLADPLSKLTLVNPIVLGIPRGGVVLASEISKALDADLDVLIVKKLGAPGNPELAIGAIISEDNYFLNDEIVSRFNVSQDHILSEIKSKANEIHTRRKLYYGQMSHDIKLEGRDVIIVDDGIATGSTIEMAVLAIKKSKPRSIIIAAAVAPQDTIDNFISRGYSVVCPHIEEFFTSVGAFYADFDQVTDEEVMSLLNTKSPKRL